MSSTTRPRPGFHPCLEKRILPGLKARAPRDIPLNATPSAPELAPLLGRLTDAWAVAHPGEPGLTYPAGVPAQCIDYVLVSSSVGVRGADVPVTDASDHRPVVADLSVARGR